MTTQRRAARTASRRTASCGPAASTGTCPGRALRGSRSPRRRHHRRRRPARLPDRAAHRPLAERQVHRPGAVERAARLRGARSTGRSTPAQFDALHARHDGATSQGKELFVQDCYAGADPAYRLPVRVVTRVRLAQPVRAQPVHRRADRRGAAGAPARVHRASTAPSFKADPARHGTRSDVVIVRQLRASAGAHRRHAATPARSRSRSSPC